MEDKELQIGIITLAQLAILAFVSGALIAFSAYGAVVAIWTITGLYLLELAKIGIMND